MTAAMDSGAVTRILRAIQALGQATVVDLIREGIVEIGYHGMTNLRVKGERGGTVMLCDGKGQDTGKSISVTDYDGHSLRVYLSQILRDESLGVPVLIFTVYPLGSDDPYGSNQSFAADLNWASGLVSGINDLLGCIFERYVLPNLTECAARPSGVDQDAYLQSLSLDELAELAALTRPNHIGEFS